MLKRFQLLKLTALSILIAANVTPVYAEDSKAPTQILINNVHVWDGTSDDVTKKISVLVEGKLIKKQWMSGGTTRRRGRNYLT